MAEKVDRKHKIDRNADRKYTHENADKKFKMDMDADRNQFFELEIENELRVLVGENSGVKIELLSGLAEIYGTEMELDKEYSLPLNSSIAIFTWHGCYIKLSGSPEDAFVVNGTAMILSVVLHTSLEERRLQAEAGNKKGPVVLVVGHNDVGKNALCRLLLNYAVRLGHHPLFIDLDVGQSSISFPGTIGVLTVEKPADIVTGFDDHPVQVYQYGHRSAWQSIKLYSLLLQRLSLTLKSDLRETNQNVKTSGVIINGCDWSRCEVRHHGYGTISLIVQNFEIDVLCVIHEEDLFVQLQRDIPSNVKMIFIPKMCGDFERGWVVKSRSRESRMHEYFFGPTNKLQPFMFEVKYSDIQVFKVMTKSVERFTQFSGEVKQNEAQLMSVQFNSKLVDQVLALSSADNVDEELMYKHVIGFICVTHVDIERETITVLSPKPGPLPKKILLSGTTRIKKRR